MHHNAMSNELFNDGWRDPGDDAHRMVYYVRWTLGFFGGLALCLYSLDLMMRRQGVEIQTAPDYQTSNRLLPYLMLPLGLLLMAWMGMRIYPELMRLKGQKVSAESLVAGGFVLGLVLVALGVERLVWSIAGSSRGESLVMAGGTVLVVTISAGVFFAVRPRLRSRPKTLSGATILSRYAIDKKLMEIEDHPDPFGEECVAMVRLRTAEGAELNLRANPAAYEMASPGVRGEARVAGKRLLAFRGGK